MTPESPKIAFWGKSLKKKTLVCVIPYAPTRAPVEFPSRKETLPLYTYRYTPLSQREVYLLYSVIPRLGIITRNIYPIEFPPREETLSLITREYISCREEEDINRYQVTVALRGPGSTPIPLPPRQGYLSLR
jgi:hypothetical protein